MQFEPRQYDRAALERIRQANDLYRRESLVNHHTVAFYVAGLAVECMLRAFLTRKSREFDGRHDLNVLFTSSGIIDFNPVVGELTELSDELLVAFKKELGSAIATVNRSWGNNLRYASESRLRSHFHDQSLERGIKGDALVGKTPPATGSSLREPHHSKGYHPVGSLAELAENVKKYLQDTLAPAKVLHLDAGWDRGHPRVRSIRGRRSTWIVRTWFGTSSRRRSIAKSFERSPSWWPSLLPKTRFTWPAESIKSCRPFPPRPFPSSTPSTARTTTCGSESLDRWAVPTLR